MNDLFEIPETESNGVYAILNAEENRVYVGQTSNLRKRATQHMNALKNGNHQNILLNFDRNKKFYFKIILENVKNPEILPFLEKIYMQVYINLGYQLYNLSPKNSLKSCRLYDEIGLSSYEYFRSPDFAKDVFCNPNIAYFIVKKGENDEFVFSEPIEKALPAIEKADKMYLSGKNIYAVVLSTTKNNMPFNILKMEKLY